MRTDIFYEVMYFMHCTMSRGIGIQFCWVPSHCGLYWNEKYHTNHLNKTQWKTRPKHCTITYNFRLMGLLQYLRRLWRKNLKERKSAMPSCSRYLARVIYKLRLSSWNIKYSRNITCVCKNTLSVKHILVECPITTELFQKNGYDFNACNNVRDILYNTDVINSIVKLIVYSPVGKLL